MNGYWDAVARAALDLPADTKPGPGSRFEPDATESGLEALEFVEEGNDATGPTPGHRAESVPGMPTETPREPRHPVADGRLEVARVEPAPARPQADASTASDRESGTMPSAVSAAPSPTTAVSPLAPREVHHVDHVEVHRVERTEAIVESVARVIPDVQEPAAAGPEHQSVAASPGEAPRPVVAPVASDASKPIAAVAELVLPPAPSPDRVQAPEPAPLVIEIDRIDIRIEPEAIAPTAPASAPRRAEAAVPSLSDYLARRSEARA